MKADIPDTRQGATESQRTLTKHLLAWVLGALVIVWVSFIVVGYETGEHEADELTDGHLASVAAILAAYGSGGEFTPGRVIQPPASSLPLRAHDYQQSMSVVIWDAAGRVLTHMGAAPLPVFTREEGFATLHLGTPPGEWRVFSRWSDDRTRKVMVLLSSPELRDLADDIAEQISQPGLWLLPVVALVLGLAIRRGLRPLYRLSDEVHALDIHKPQPLHARPQHAELAAMVEAIQLLVERYHAALTRERALADEFAHELRTPLASLSLQARALRDAAGPARDEALARLERDVRRANEVLTHLLALARAERAELEEAAESVDLQELAREVIAEFVPAAETSGHELALGSPGPFIIQGHPVLLMLALRNLIENALSHTPPGTQVEVQIDPAARWIQVCDQAPPGEASSNSRPAGAPLGLGLGHRVVEKIAAIHGARFERPVAPAARNCYRMAFAPSGLRNT